MLDEEGFIPAIFNYCDRWCERCAFVSRCRVGSDERALQQKAEVSHDDSPEAQEARNAAFWEQMRQILEQTKAMLTTMARERGIDLEKVTAEDPSLALRAGKSDRMPRKDAGMPRKLRPPSAAHRAVLRAAKSYFKKVDTWFDVNAELLERKGHDLISAARMELPGTDPAREAEGIKDALEVIRWYAPQIEVKLQRASRRDADDEEQFEFADTETAAAIAAAAQHDADGSAKVALIGMDRSLAAWGRLYEALPDAGDDILAILVPLDRLRRATEEVFPNAREFVRPGLDEPAEPVEN